MDLSVYQKKNSSNIFVDSIVPDICKSSPCVLGVDEAGRGPVLGPMVYGVCFCPVDQHQDLKELGAADSKTLSEAKRDELFETLDSKDYVGWSLQIISPLYISNCMYKRDKISLNEVSQTSAADLIQRVMDRGANITEVYVDTVGDPQKYQSRLEAIFPSLTITVSKKADALFPCVSAASICAKVSRDKAIREWEFPEGIEQTTWGSGYPGDGVTKNFLLSSLDPVFGFPGLVRFSWSTAEKIMDEKCVKLKWEGDEDDEMKTPSVLQYFSKKRKSTHDEPAVEVKQLPKRHFFFENLNLNCVESL